MSNSSRAPARPPPPPGGCAFLAEVALADDLALRGGGEHLDRPLAQHRVEDVPRGVVHGARAGPRPRRRARSRRSRRASRRSSVTAMETRAVSRTSERVALGRHLHVERVVAPPDLDLRHAELVGGLASDRRARSDACRARPAPRPRGRASSRCGRTTRFSQAYGPGTSGSTRPRTASADTKTFGP